MNITLKRWLTIIFYGALSAFLIKAFIQVEWIQKGATWFTNAFVSFGFYPQKLFLILLGFLLYQFLLKMNIYTKKGSFKTWWFYPPITFITLPSIFVLIDFPNELTLLETVDLIVSNQAINLYCLMAFLPIVKIWGFVFKNTSPKQNENEGKRQENKASITSNSTYDDYQKWFEDDEPIAEKDQLSTDLQPYVVRIRDRINNTSVTEKKSVHISLVGSFGSGKSSIIKCVEKELYPNFICCNIDTWAATPQSINAFVLSKVVESVSDYVDMSSFRSLPAEYIEALKLGNNASKLLAIFSGIASASDPLRGLTKLNSVLGAINKKLLITIQDVDRSSSPKKTINELASLLDKLKGQSNVSFIIALGYEDEITETIRKVCDYREDIIKPDNHFILLNFINTLNQRATDNYFVTSNSRTNENGDVIVNTREIEIKLRSHMENHFNPYEIISSQRSFKHICRRIDSIWQAGKLMGEIDLESLCLLVTLREELPLIFSDVIRNNMSLFNDIRKLKNNEKTKYIQGELNNQSIKEVEIKTLALNKCAQYYPSILNFEATTSFLDYLFKCNNDLGQGALYKYRLIKHSNYLKRVMSEFVLNTELKDQEALKLFKNIDETGSFETLISNFQNDVKGHHWIVAYTRFYQGYFKPTDKNVYEAIYIKMADFYYKDVVKQNRTSNSLINHTDIQKFMILLLEKCLTTDNVGKLFELTLNIPTILMANTHNVEPSSCLKLFLSKEQDEELYNIFINKLRVNNEMSKQLFIVDSTNQSLAWIADQFTPKDPKAFEIMKEIILSLLEKNDKGNEFYEFDLWFVCYLLDGNRFSVEYNKSLDELALLYKLKFLITEVELLKSSLNQLNIDDVGKYYRHLPNPKEIHQRVLSALEKHV